MRFFNILFAIIYLCLQLGEPTRSAAQDWADSVEHKVSHNVQLFSQPALQLNEAEAGNKEKSADTPPAFALPLALNQLPVLTFVSAVVGQTAQLHHAVLLLLASPRAPPALV